MWEVPPLRFFAICRDVPPTSVARVPPEAWNGGSVHAPSQWLPPELEAPRSPARNSAAEPHNRPLVDAPRTSDPRSLRFSFPNSRNSRDSVVDDLLCPCDIHRLISTPRQQPSDRNVLVDFIPMQTVATDFDFLALTRLR